MIVVIVVIIGIVFFIVVCFVSVFMVLFGIVLIVLLFGCFAVFGVSIEFLKDVFLNYEWKYVVLGVESDFGGVLFSAFFLYFFFWFVNL